MTSGDGGTLSVLTQCARQTDTLIESTYQHHILHIHTYSGMCSV